MKQVKEEKNALGQKPTLSKRAPIFISRSAEEEIKFCRDQIKTMTNKCLWLTTENNLIKENHTKAEALRKQNQLEKIEITKYVHQDTGKRVKLNIPECPICLEPLMENLKGFYPCGHVFHSYCCIEMSTHGTKRKCPICRVDLLRNPLDLIYSVEPADVLQKSEFDDSLVLEKDHSFSSASPSKDWEHLARLKDMLKYKDDIDFIKKELNKFEVSYLKMKAENSEQKQENQDLKENNDKMTVNKNDKIVKQYKSKPSIQNLFKEPLGLNKNSLRIKKNEKKTTKIKTRQLKLNFKK